MAIGPTGAEYVSKTSGGSGGGRRGRTQQVRVPPGALDGKTGGEDAEDRLLQLLPSQGESDAAGAASEGAADVAAGKR